MPTLTIATSTFILGLMAGFSTCAALVGSIVFSISKTWPGKGKIPSILLFHVGRFVSFAILGAILGLLGKSLGLSPMIGALIIIVVSILMLTWGLSLLGLSFLSRLQVKSPKAVARFIFNHETSQKKVMPLLLGFLTILLPCGFTLSAQAIAMSSGSVLKGGIILLSFALGTALPLVFIGFVGARLWENKKRSSLIGKVAGISILLAALYNINNQLNVLGLPSLNNLTQSNSVTSATPSSTQSGVQIVKIEASSKGYEPKYFVVNVGEPVRMEITGNGISGCTSAIIAPDLFEGDIRLQEGKTVSKEFTPQNTGRFKFSCWMGMITGTIEVVEK